MSLGASNVYHLRELGLKIVTNNLTESCLIELILQVITIEDFLILTMSRLHEISGVSSFLILTLMSRCGILPQNYLTLLFVHSISCVKVTRLRIRSSTSVRFIINLMRFSPSGGEKAGGEKAFWVTKYIP